MCVDGCDMCAASVSVCLPMLCRAPLHPAAWYFLFTLISTILLAGEHPLFCTPGFSYHGYYQDFIWRAPRSYVYQSMLTAG